MRRGIWGFSVFSACALASALFATQVYAQAAADVKACEEKKGDEALLPEHAPSGQDRRARISRRCISIAAWSGTPRKATTGLSRITARRSSSILSIAKRFNNRGNAYRAKRDLDLAIADYESAIKINPKRGLYHRNRGNVLMDKRAIELAMKA